MQSVEGELKKANKCIRIDAVVSNPVNPDLKQKVDFIVDTGAVGCAIPIEVAKKLRLESRGQVEAVMADGSQRTVDVSFAVLQLGGKRLYAWIAYGKGFDALLGIDVMEVLGVHVDVPNRKLLMPVDRFDVKRCRIKFGWNEGKFK
ncbi:MAG: aspartyl protease family protein [Candidatus Bathyarchaeia archaeon]